jgi:nicotinamidase-related amidase
MTDLSATALLLCDLQNDFLHPEGAYGRAGLGNPDIAAVVPTVKPLVEAFRAAGGFIASTHFTLVPLRGGEPFISPHLRHVRPFLKRGDFLPGGWGHRMVDELGVADAAVEKVNFSAFYMSRLEWVLARAEIRRLLVGGIVTNGGVASTIRDAHVREFDVTLLSDACAAFDRRVHDVAVEALRPVARVATVAEMLAEIA